MNAEPTTETPRNPTTFQSDPRASAVLLEQLVSCLRGPQRDGAVHDGRPQLWLFGERVDLAVPLRRLLEGLRRGDAARVELGSMTRARHEAATRDPDGYLVSATGMHVAGHRGERIDDQPADAMSLRLFDSSFHAPMNALLRSDPGQPSAWLHVVIGLRDAAEHVLGGDGPSLDDALVRRMTRLHEHLRGLVSSDDPRLPRVLAEVLVHAWMAMRALGRQRRYDRSDGSTDRLHRLCSLPTATLADLRWAASRGERWRNPGLIRTATAPTRCRRLDRVERPHAMEIRPRPRGSAGRWLEGEVDDGVIEPQVWFPPGTPFEVVDVVEHQASDGAPRTLVRLSERPHAAADSAGTLSNASSQRLGMS